MDIVTNVPLDIKIGDEFKNLEDFEIRFNQQCKINYVQFYKKDTRSIQSAVSRRIKRHLDPSLKFYSIKWCCIHGGRKFKSQSKGIRNTPTLRKEDLCPAFIHIRVAESGTAFIVVDLNFNHNHRVTEELFKQLPHNRRLPDDAKAYTKKLLQMKANKHLIREELERRLNQTVTLKSITNLQQACKYTQNNIDVISELIQSKFGVACNILIDANNTFRGLFFSSEEMTRSMTAYPEVIFLGPTFKLLALEASVYMILNIDGNGENDIVAISILMSEDKDHLEWFLQSFKDSLPPETASKIANVMTDLTERQILKKLFPGVKLHISTLHVVQIFRNEISQKFKLSPNDRNFILELLQKLVRSKTEIDFFDLLKKIKRKSGRVYDYLEENWIEIRKEWCPYLGGNCKTFMNTTNRLEGVNSKLTAMIDKNSSLEEFVHKLVIVRDSMEKEKNARVANHLNKRRTSSLPNGTQSEYLKLLTPYAFDKLKSQFALEGVYDVQYGNHQFSTSIDSCTCYFHESMGLPCKHIFCVRRHMHESLFDPCLVLERWKMDYFISNCRFLNQKNVEASSMNVDEILINEAEQAVQDKFRKTLTKSKLVATLASELQGDRYNKVNLLLDAIINSLQNEENTFVDNAVSIIETRGISNSPERGNNNNYESSALLNTSDTPISTEDETFLNGPRKRDVDNSYDGFRLSNIKVPTSKRRGCHVTVTGQPKRQKKSKK